MPAHEDLEQGRLSGDDARDDLVVGKGVPLLENRRVDDMHHFLAQAITPALNRVGRARLVTWCDVRMTAVIGRYRSFRYRGSHGPYSSRAEKPGPNLLGLRQVLPSRRSGLRQRHDKDAASLRAVRE